MFTGIIKYLLAYKIDGSELILLDVPVEIIDKIEIGSSISVNGVCLTVTKFADNTITFFVMEETFKITSLSNINYSKLNVELSMINGSIVDGHYVTGHVDCTGIIYDLEDKKDGSMDLSIQVSNKVSNNSKYKDSISIDGISLTIAEIDKDNIRVSIIPHTKNNTIIQYYTVGTIVNIEFNKYIDNITKDNIIKDDSYWMKEAIKEGEKGRYVAPPNPWVGCVIVDPKTNTCIGRGYHRGPGTDHGEVDALKSLNDNKDAEGSHVYTTLEPCHYYEGNDELLKERSGCDMKLIEAKVGRVIVGMLDADLRVLNTGMDELITAGIQVDMIDEDTSNLVKLSFKEYIESRDKINPDTEEYYKFDTLDSALADLKDGKYIILADESDREDEYDLVSVSSTCTKEKMDFFLHYTTGKHCVVLSPERAKILGIPRMIPRDQNNNAQQTPFGMPIDSNACLTTGVDSNDRSISVVTLANGKKGDYTLSGHTDTLISHPGGILARRGHTEGSIALSRLIGMEDKDQAMLIGELMIRDLNHPKSGQMMRYKEAKELADKYNLKLIHMSQLLDNLVPVVSTIIPLDNIDHKWNVSLYKCKESPDYYHKVCSYGVLKDKEIFVRIHSECWTGDCLGSMLCDCGKQLELAKKKIVDYGSGVIIFPANHEGRGIGLANKLKAYNLQRIEDMDTYQANEELGFDKDQRIYDDIPYILRSLGVSKIKLLSANPDKINILSDKFDDIKHEKLTVETDSKHVEKYLEVKHKHFNNKEYKKIHILLAVSEYYNVQCHQLVDRVKDQLEKQYNGSIKYSYLNAPGTREIPYYINKQLDRGNEMNINSNNKFDGVFVVGICMKGDTDHHNIIATATTNALINLEFKYDIPITTAIIAAKNMDIIEAKTKGDKCTAESLASTLLKSIMI